MNQEQWINIGQILKEEMLAYNWKYRAKICLQCPLETQKRLDCKRFNNYRMIKGQRIQETHCKKLIKARTAKFKNRIYALERVSPLKLMNDKRMEP